MEKENIPRHWGIFSEQSTTGRKINNPSLYECKRGQELNIFQWNSYKGVIQYFYTIQGPLNSQFIYCSVKAECSSLP